MGTTGVRVNEYDQTKAMENADLIICLLYTSTLLEAQIYPSYPRLSDMPKTKKRPSSKAQRNLNDKNARRYLIRLGNINFGKGDLWCTFGWNDDKLPADEERARKDIKNFIAKINYRRKRKGLGNIKYIYVLAFDGLSLIHILKTLTDLFYSAYSPRQKRYHLSMTLREKDGEHIIKILQNGREAVSYTHLATLGRDVVSIAVITHHTGRVALIIEPVHHPGIFCLSIRMHRALLLCIPVPAIRHPGTVPLALERAVHHDVTHTLTCELTLKLSKHEDNLEHGFTDGTRGVELLI